MRAPRLPLLSLASLLLIFMLPVGSAAVSQSSEVCLRNPVDGCAGNQFEELGQTDAGTDGRAFAFEGDISDAGSTETGTVILQFKGSSSTQFSNESSTFYGGPKDKNDNLWGSSTDFPFTADADKESFDIFDGESLTNTIINNNEHTFNLTSYDFADSQIDLLVDGNQELLNFADQFELESIPVQAFDGNSTTLVLQEYPDLNSPEDFNEYRVVWEDSDTGDLIFGDSVFFSVDKGQNIPADKRVSIGGNEVDQPRTLTGVTPFSNVNLTVFQGTEQDPVNVTLVSGGTDLYTISSGDDFGAFRSIVDDVGDSIFARFREDTSNQTFRFPAGADGFLSQNSTTYTFHFKIMDKGEAGNPVRTTKEYEITTTTAVNEDPTISSIEFDLSNASNIPVQNANFGDIPLQIEATVDDPDSDLLRANATFRHEFDNFTVIDNAAFDSIIGDTYIWDVNSSKMDSLNGEIADSGNWTVSVEFEDSAGNRANETRRWEYPFLEPNITTTTQNNALPKDTAAIQNTAFNATMTVECPQFECINENESIQAFLDPQPSPESQNVLRRITILIMEAIA